jgi:broad specificity phosphatase PhoE
VRVPAEKVTTIFLVRHADINRTINPSDPDPGLTLQGLQRANELAGVLSKVEIDAIYSTNTSRTNATAQPLATSRSLQISLYENLDLLVNEVKENHGGEEILVVGHSNTVPMIIDKFVGASTGYSVGLDEYYKIFIVTITKSGKWWTAQLKYGVVP